MYGGLDDIKGVGEKTQIALLQRFKSVKRLKEASQEQISEVAGQSRAAIIYNALHGVDNNQK